MPAKSLTMMYRLALIIGILFITAAVFAQEFALPTYHYYDRVLSPAEMIEREAQRVPLHCVQQLTEYALLNHYADVFRCFDTAGEAQTYSETRRSANLRLSQDIERQIQAGLLEPLPGPSVEGDSRLQSNHWALYSYSLYNGHIMNIGNGSSSGHSPVWSIWRDGNPNDITITGACAFPFAYSSAQGSLISCPFGAGGGTRSSVP